MADIELVDIVDALSRLQLNYTKLANQWYDIFLNPVPMNVTLSFYDDTGKEFEFTIPNRAKDRQFILNGEGSPNVNAVNAEIGSLYQDIVTGEVYVKYNEGATSWSCIITKDALNSIIRQIQGSPEGCEIAPIGTLCVDTMNGYMYMKRTTTGNTGWVRIDAYATSMIREVYTFFEPVKTLVINGTCENINVLSIFEDGVMLSPELYSMPYGDNKTIILKRPVNIPGDGESVEVIVQYFVDIHVAESSAEQRLVDYVGDARFYALGIHDIETSLNYKGKINEQVELPEDTSVLIVGDYFYCLLDQSRYIWNGETWDRECSAYYYMLQAQDAYEKTEYKRETAEQYLTDLTRQLGEELINIETNVVNTANDMTNLIADKEELFTTETNKVYNYAEEVSANRAKVAMMLDNVKQLEKNTHSYADYVERTVNDLALRSEVAEVEQDIRNALENNRVSLTANIQLLEDTLNTKIDSSDANLQALIENETSERLLNYAELKGSIDFNQTTFENWIAGHRDLGDFTNDEGYYKRENFPIDVKGIYHLSMDIPASNIINVTVRRDCTYYAVDIGEILEKAGEDTKFEFYIDYDKETIDLSLPDKVKDDAYTSEVDNVVSVFRCYLKNETNYAPIIEWDFQKIQWLGSEPELEPNHSYIVEFISYDMMTSWKAHILGMCQPSIEIDTFTTSFTINSDALAEADLAVGETSEIRVVAVIDGREYIMDETYEFDNTTGNVVVPMEVERRFLGKKLTSVYLKSTNTPAFCRYYSEALDYDLDQNTTYSFECENYKKDPNHSYTLAINSNTIETYMRGGLTEKEYQLYLTGDTTVTPEREPITELPIVGRFAFQTGNVGVDEDREGIYYYDPISAGESGVVFTFDVDDNVMVDPLIIKSESNRVGNIRLRYADLAAGECITSDDEVDVKTDGVVYINIEDKRASWTATPPAEPEETT